MDGSTAVTLADGVSVPIGELSGASPSVFTFLRDGALGGLVSRPVVAHMDQGIRPCIELLFNDGRTLVCTPDHRMLGVDGKWKEAGHLVVDVDEVAVGLAGPLASLTEDAERCAAWSLHVPGLGTLDCGPHRARALAFARLLGWLLTDDILSGCDSASLTASLYLGHGLDVEAVQRDLVQLTGASGREHRYRRHWQVDLPDPLLTSYTSLRLSSSERAGQVTHLPDFLLSPECPLPIVREFLGGLFGFAGSSVRVARETDGAYRFGSVGLSLSRRGSMAQQQMGALTAELFPLLARCGVSTKRIEARSQLMADESYAVTLQLSTDLTVAFATAIGFRYCCDKQQRLSAALSYFRVADRISRQRAALVADCRSAPEGSSLPSSIAAAKERLAELELLHPAVAAWLPREATALTTGVREELGISVEEAMAAYGISSTFQCDLDDGRTHERLSAAVEGFAEHGEDDGENFAEEGAGDARAEEPNDAVEMVSPSLDLNAESLPLAKAKLIAVRNVGARPVFDLTVKADVVDDASFVGNGLVLHNCHKSGVWQQLTVFRSGKNKKKMWEYDNCASLKPLVEAVGKDASLTEEQKNAAIGKLLSAPKACVLGVRHPPTGIEFGLGCSMCEDSQSSSDKLKENEAAVKAKLQTVKNELARQPRTFRYHSDLDENGVMWYLGTCGKTQPYANPAEAGFVKVVSSGLMGDSAPLSAAVGRELVRCVTTPVKNSWFVFELVDLCLSLTHYTLRHYNSWDTECLRHWVLEGGNESIQGPWEVIMSHVNDTALSKKGATHTWAVPPSSRRFRYFRLFQNGKNSNNNFYLPCSGLELYGTLYVQGDAAGEALSPRGSKAASPPPLPPPAVAHRPPHPPSSPPGPSRLFTYRHDLDTNGICYFLGTRFGQSPWQNPADLGLVRIFCSELSTQPAGAHIHAVVGREVVRVVSVPKPNQWFVVDFRPSGYRIRPSAYTLRHYSSWDLEALRNWKFEASLNGTEWYTLSMHSDDASLDRKGATHTWTLNGQQGQFTQFRVWQTGFNSNGHHYLALSGFELYGELIDNGHPISSPFDHVRALPPPPMHAPPPPLPNGAGGHFPPQFQQQSSPHSHPFPVPQLPPPPPVPPVAPRPVQHGHSAPVIPNGHMPRAGPAPSVPSLPPPDLSSTSLVPLRYHHDMDTNGLFYYLGSRGGTQPWQNPCTARAMSISCSALATNPPSAPCSALVNREVVRCVTLAKPDMWFCIDLHGNALQPSHYTLQHYSSFDTEALRHWKLEGSLDGVQWDVLSVHVNDAALQRKGQSYTWQLQSALQTPPRFFRFFRIHQTGLNSNNNHYLALSGVEFYGWLQLGGAMRNVSSPPAIPSAPPPRLPASAPPSLPGGPPPLIRPQTLPPPVPSSHPPPASSNPFAPAGGPQPSPPSAPPPPIPQSQPRSPPGVYPSHAAPGGPAPGMFFSPNSAAAPPQPPPPSFGNPFADPLLMPSRPVGPPPVGGVNPFAAPPAAVPPPLLSSINRGPSGSASSSLSPTSSWPSVRPLPPPPPPPQSPNASSVPFVEGMTFEYSYDFDECGVMYWLGTRQKTAAWRNPDDLGLVRVTSVPLAVNPPSAPASAIVGREVVRCVTLPNRESWFCVDLLTLYCRPTAYTLRHYDSYDSEALRDWKLQGSNDGAKWSKLLSHKKDEHLHGKGSSHTWTLPATKKAFRMFRILQTGKNSNGHWYCALSGFELYGQLFATPPKNKD